VAAARASVVHVLDPSAPAPKPVGDKRAREAYRVFMSFYRKDVVAGRSGELLTPGPLEESVKFHAVQAATHDPWRAPLAHEELPSLSLTLSLPAVPRKADLHEILPGRDGVSLRYKNRENVFLPDAWKFLPHPAVFLAELAAQMRLEPWRWRSDGAQILAFQVKSVAESEVKDLPPPEPAQKAKPAEETIASPF